MPTSPPPDRFSLGEARRWAARTLGRGLARLSYAHFVEPVWLRRNHWLVPHPDWPAALDGLRVLHLTDFHLCGRVPVEHIRQALDVGQAQRCDLVALTGDFVHAGYRWIDRIAAMAGTLHAPLGVFAVLGNHDYSVRNALGVRKYPRLAATIAGHLRGAGVDVLDNAHRVRSFRGHELAVAGVADRWSRDEDVPGTLDAIPGHLPRILLAHNPQSSFAVGARRCELTLSGHTHGGQVRPLLLDGRGARSGRLRPTFTAGMYCHDTGWLYVSTGVGYTVRLRYRTRPEVAVLELRHGAGLPERSSF